nr:MAG TPA: hypothetical protein [Caudoviricetes sp.]
MMFSTSRNVVLSACMGYYFPSDNLSIFLYTFIYKKN